MMGDGQCMFLFEQGSITIGVDMISLCESETLDEVSAGTGAVS
jgi:hypothetical protein